MFSKKIFFDIRSETSSKSSFKKNDKIERWLNKVFPMILEAANTVGAKIYRDRKLIGSLYTLCLWLIKPIKIGI